MKHTLRHLSSALLLTSGILYSQNLWACERPVVYGYDDIDCLSDGLARVSQNDKWGFIDNTGKVVIPLKYDWVGSFYKDVVGVGDLSTGEAFYINRQGERLY